MKKIVLFILCLLALVGCIIMVGRDNQGAIRSTGDFEPDQDTQIGDNIDTTRQE